MQGQASHTRGTAWAKSNLFAKAISGITYKDTSVSPLPAAHHSAALPSVPTVHNVILPSHSDKKRNGPSRPASGKEFSTLVFCVFLS